MSSRIKNKELVTIRDMNLSDIDPIFELEKDIFSDPWSREAFREQIEGADWGGFVAESQSQIIGYACYYIAHVEAHLTNIAVVKNFRRKSVAKQLLDNILLIVKKCNCEYLLLEVRPSNVSAISFYEINDFKLLYRRPNYYHSPVEDALVMVRYFENDGDM